MLRCTKVKLFALIDVEQEHRWLRLAKLLQTALGCVEEIAQVGVALGEPVGPLVPASHTAGIARIKLPQPQKRLDQPPYWLGSRPAREKAPAAAGANRLRPRSDSLSGFRPTLSHQGSQHPRLRERRLADARAPEEKRKP